MKKISSTKTIKKDSGKMEEMKLSESKKAKIVFPKITSEEMMSHYLHFGHRKSRMHPKMQSFIYTVRNNVSIINIEKTKEYFERALAFVGKVVSSGGKILFIATRVPGKNLIEEYAKDLEMFYVHDRWLGGTLTNFKTISSRLAYLKELEAKKKSGELAKYTKKEQHDFEQELFRLNKKFDGIKKMEKLPDAVFILNLCKDSLAAREARSRRISVVAITDTDADPQLADYPIPANDDAVQSVTYILDKVREVVRKATK